MRRQTALVAAVVFIPLCIWLVDRPVARLAHDRFYDSRVFAVADSLLRLLVPGLVFLAVGFAMFAAWWLVARPLPLWAESALRGTAAGLVALGLAIALKTVIGRSQAALFITDRVYAFRPMELASSYEAFPSAAMAAMSALLVGWGLPRAGWRVAGGVLVTLLGVSLLITNSHWLSDLAGGWLVGWSTARIAVRRTSPGADR